MNPLWLIPAFTLGILLGLWWMRRRTRSFLHVVSAWLLAQKPEGADVLPPAGGASLSAALQHHLRRWRQAFLAQTQFAQHASHELQTPLAVIKGQIELLVQSPRLEEDEMEALQLILQNTNRLAKLNGALILLSSIDERRYEKRESVDIAQLTHDLLRNFQDLIQARHLRVELEIEEGASVHMNRSLADIMLANLLQNAIRHNVEHGWIHISLQSNRLVIRNTGLVLPGSPEKLFDRFVRHSETEEGLGLGLSIIQRICALYGFEVQYTTSDSEHTLSVVF